MALGGEFRESRMQCWGIPIPHPTKTSLSKELNGSQLQSSLHQMHASPLGRLLVNIKQHGSTEIQTQFLFTIPENLKK